MRNIIVLLVFAMAVISCKQNEDSKSSKQNSNAIKESDYTITGYVKGAQQGTKFVLTILGIDGKPDTAIFKGDKFEFKGRVPEPLIAEINSLDSADHPGAPLKLLLENAFINIEANIDSFNKADVIGGPQNTDFGKLKGILNLYWDSIKVVADNIREASVRKDTIEAQKSKVAYEQMEAETRDAIQQYAVEHPESISSAYYILQYYSTNVNVEELDSVYNSFDSSIHNSIYVKKIRTILDAAKRTSVGSVAPELNTNNKNFDTISIADYRGKFLLINFWASWCLDCRQQHRKLVSTYRKYKNKGFDILGVSLDTDRRLWRQAIKKDNLTWKQVSDFKGMESTVVPLYGIGTIPSNFLIDKEGKIIAKDVYGEDLQQKLNELLK